MKTFFKVTTSPDDFSFNFSRYLPLLRFSVCSPSPLSFSSPHPDSFVMSVIIVNDLTRPVPVVVTSGSSSVLPEDSTDSQSLVIPANVWSPSPLAYTSTLCRALAQATGQFLLPVSTTGFSSPSGGRNYTGYRHLITIASSSTGLGHWLSTEYGRRKVELTLTFSSVPGTYPGTLPGSMAAAKLSLTLLETVVTTGQPNFIFTTVASSDTSGGTDTFVQASGDTTSIVSGAPASANLSLVAGTQAQYGPVASLSYITSGPVAGAPPLRFISLIGVMSSPEGALTSGVSTLQFYLDFVLKVTYLDAPL